MKPKLKAPETKRLIVYCDKLLSILPQFCFQFQRAALQPGEHHPRGVLQHRAGVPGRRAARQRRRLGREGRVMSFRHFRQFQNSGVSREHFLEELLAIRNFCPSLGLGTPYQISLKTSFNTFRTLISLSLMTP